MNEVVRYSEGFKLRVINELERGRFRTQTEARDFYGLGAATLSGWLKRYGRNELLRRVVRVERPEDIEDQKKLKKRIRELEKALADSKCEEIAARAFFGVACEEFGVKDIEAFKKTSMQSCALGSRSFALCSGADV